MTNKILIGLLSILTCALTPCLASTKKPMHSQPHFYLGAIAGYGSTTWKGLVPQQENQNLALSLSTPIAANEGGVVYGGVLGCEFTPSFALEANYMRYPTATVFFDSMSIFSLENKEITEFKTHTETITLMAKLLLPFQGTNTRLFSGIGAAGLHRQDLLTNDWILSPSFSIGLNYMICEHIMSEIVGNYTTGYAESMLNPSGAYYPFLYSLSIHLAYRF